MDRLTGKQHYLSSRAFAVLTSVEPVSTSAHRSPTSMKKTYGDGVLPTCDIQQEASQTHVSGCKRHWGAVLSHTARPELLMLARGVPLKF